MAYVLTRKEIKKVGQALLVPNEERGYVWDMDLERLSQAGYKTMILDVDRTLLGYRERVMSLQHVNWIQKCQSYGFEVFFLSNNRSKKRIKRVAEQVNVNGIYCAMKPFTMGLKQLQQTYNLDLETSIVVGDQLFKDTLVANWMGVYNVLVEPLETPLPLFSRLQYTLERYLMKKLSN